MASLDYAVDYLEEYSYYSEEKLYVGINEIKNALQINGLIEVVNNDLETDCFKLLIRGKGISGYGLQKHLDKVGVFSELANETYVLLIIGLMRYDELVDLSIELEKRMKLLSWESSEESNKALSFANYSTATFPFSYDMLENFETENRNMTESIGRIMATNIVPYPPGIPYPMKGERIMREHVDYVKQVFNEGGKIQGFTNERDLVIPVYIEK